MEMRQTLSKRKLFLVGFAIGSATLLIGLVLGFRIERSSYLQLYNFNAAVASGCDMMLSTLERSGVAVEELFSAGFLEEYKMDGESGAGWCVPMQCRLSRDSSPWEADETGCLVVLFMWRGRPFCALALGGGVMPKICVVRSFGLKGPATSV